MTESIEQEGEEQDSRFRVRLTIAAGPDRDRTITNYVVNMSTGGMFVETTELLPVDTLLAVALLLPGSETAMTCTARVAWTNGPNSLKKQSLPYGMGLQFLTPLAR